VKYLILIYHNPRAVVTEEQIAAGIRAHASLVEDLSASGEMIAAEVLVDPTQAKRVASGDGRTTTTDGPFPELKEHLAGVYIVECESIERAVEHAARIPEAASGMVEVRQVAVEASATEGWHPATGGS
jgi:hypothetical protein